MNRIYLVSNDGRIFFAESSSSTFELLNVNDCDEAPIRVKRLSSCDWCLWVLSSTFHVYLYVFQSDTPIEYQEITYENQRRYNLFSSESFTSNLMPTDRSCFSSKDGLVELPKENFKLPSNCWVWESDWNFEQNISDGWEYAIDFPSKYYSNFFRTACVRRKKWFRNRLFTSFNRFIKIPSPSENEFILDIAIGGWAIPYCAKGFLSVWIITSTGNLFFRKNVSNINLEGSEWMSIKLPKRTSALSISCSTMGDLWLVTYSGNALLRTGITRDCPYGTDWLLVEQPSCGLKQISIGKNTIWALDHNGGVFYRGGCKDDKPQGGKWVSVPSNMSNISVSCTNQLWGIETDEMSLYFRIGIDDENTSGTGWKKVNLKCKKVNSLPSDEISEIIKQDELNEIRKTIYTIRKQKSIEEPINNNNNDDNNQEQLYFEDSIYDSNTDSISSTKTLSPNDNDYILKRENPIYTQKDLSLKNLIDKNNDFNFITETLNNTDLEEFINKFRQASTTRILQQQSQLQTEAKLPAATTTTESNKNLVLLRDRSDSSLSKKSSDGSYSLSNFSETTMTKSNYSAEDMKSINSTNSMDTLGELTEIGFKVCAANSFNLDNATIPMSWFDENPSKCDLYEIDDLSDILNVEWRNNVLNDLRKRNIKEYSNVDRISVPYEDSSWSRKDDFTYAKGNNLIECSLEIVTEHKTSTKTFEASLLIKSIRRSKLSWQIDFKTVILVTRWMSDIKPTSPGFAIFVDKQSAPFIFLSNSEKKLDDWFTQMSVYCSKLSGVTSLLSAITLTNSEGNAYYAYLKNNKPLLIKQIDGHFKIVEKHKSGITFGIGENGKLWILSVMNNLSLDSYKGPYLQIDDSEVYTYENQRWNVISGILGLRKNGFTNIGFPTDRYQWSDETGKIRRRKDECNLPSPLFNWSSNWQIDFSTPGGVDQEGWQYAFDFPSSYHESRLPTDFVRRRRWCRKCRIRVTGLWKEVSQTHQLTSIAMDQEPIDSKLLPTETILIWATDRDGFILTTQINESNPSSIKWQNVPSQDVFRWKNVSIGLNLRVWGIDMEGNVHFRFAVKKENNYCGTGWNYVEPPENIIAKFKQISVGNDTVWAVTDNDDLYFRENITKSFPEGTSWTKVECNIKYVTVDAKNEVYAISNNNTNPPNLLLFRERTVSDNLKGSGWKPVISMKCEMVSNRGKFF